MSDETKTYVFGGGDCGLMSAIAPLLSLRGIDPSVLALMNRDGEFGGSAFIWVIFLFFLMGWGGNGFGGPRGGFDGQINNDFGRDLLMQAISGNRTAVSELATNLNCSVGQIQGAISALGSSVQSVGNSVGVTGMQVINAIQSGNCDLASKLSSCCCENKMLITTQGYENRIANTENTALLASKIDAQTTLISDKFCELEKRELNDKITSLTAANTALKGLIDNAAQTAAITSYVNSAVAPILADVSAIKAATPSTVSVPWPQLTAVPVNPPVPGYYGAYPYNGGWA